MKEIKLSGFIPTEAKIEQRANDIAKIVEEGLVDPLQVDMQLKAMADIIDAAREKIKRNVLNEASKYHKNEQVAFGVSFSVCNRGRSYNYEADPEYNALIQAANERKELLSKAVKAGAPILDEDSGALIPVVPVKNPGKDSISYTIK